MPSATFFDSGSFPNSLGEMIVEDVGVPEPATWSLLAAGVALVLFSRKLRPVSR